MSEQCFAEAHRQLADEIDDEVRRTASWTGRDRLSDRVRAAIASVPRHEFVTGHDRPAAYANRPLAIGHGQTISQPYIVAIMSELLDIGPDDRVLEVGTGCGYQTAVLAAIAGHVYSLELIPTLADAARERLRSLGCGNVDVRVGDGYAGLREQAPFDGIIVTAAPPDIPGDLVEQLAPGGRLVIPVGAAGDTQMLYRCVRADDGTLVSERKLPVAFVPMVPGERTA